MNDKLKEVYVRNNDVLVTPVRDYYNKNSEKFNSANNEVNNYEVGIVEKVGSNHPKEWEGKIAFYTKQIGNMINFRDKGKYLQLDGGLILNVIMDQDKNNY